MKASLSAVAVATFDNVCFISTPLALNAWLIPVMIPCMGAVIVLNMPKSMVFIPFQACDQSPLIMPHHVCMMPLMSCITPRRIVVTALKLPSNAGANISQSAVHAVFIASDTDSKSKPSELMASSI